MARLLEPEFPELDMKKVLDMCLFHDLGEIEGDVPGFNKNEHDDQREFGLFKTLIAGLPQTQRDELLAVQIEFDAGTSPEAQLAHALDKLESVIQHNEAALSTWTALEHDLLLTYGEMQATFHPFLKVLRTLVKQQSLDKLEGEQEPEY